MMTMIQLTTDQKQNLKAQLFEHSIIRVFGNSGVGKGTLSTNLSDFFGIPNIDTGKYWRAITVWYYSHEDEPEWNSKNIEQAFQKVHIQIENNEMEVYLGSQKLHYSQLRSPQVSNKVADLSSNPYARSLFYKNLEILISEYGKPVVADGRGATEDYIDNLEKRGWKVARLMLTADLSITAKRRTKEMVHLLAIDDESIVTDPQRQHILYDETLTALKIRNQKDMDTAISTGMKIVTDDTITISTDNLDIVQVFELALVKLKESKIIDNSH